MVIHSYPPLDCHAKIVAAAGLQHYLARNRLPMFYAEQKVATSAGHYACFHVPMPVTLRTQAGLVGLCLESQELWDSGSHRRDPLVRMMNMAWIYRIGSCVDGTRCKICAAFVAFVVGVPGIECPSEFYSRKKKSVRTSKSGCG